MDYQTMKRVEKELLPLVQQLKHHHKSQGKDGPPKCSTGYHRQLAGKLDSAEDILVKLLWVNNGE